MHRAHHGFWLRVLFLASSFSFELGDVLLIGFHLALVVSPKTHSAAPRVPLRLPLGDGTIQHRRLELRLSIILRRRRRRRVGGFVVLNAPRRRDRRHARVVQPRQEAGLAVVREAAPLAFRFLITTRPLVLRALDVPPERRVLGLQDVDELPHGIQALLGLVELRPYTILGLRLRLLLRPRARDGPLGGVEVDHGSWSHCCASRASGAALRSFLNAYGGARQPWALVRAVARAASLPANPSVSIR